MVTVVLGNRSSSTRDRGDARATPSPVRSGDGGLRVCLADATRGLDVGGRVEQRELAILGEVEDVVLQDPVLLPGAQVRVTEVGGQRLEHLDVEPHVLLDLTGRRSGDVLIAGRHRLARPGQQGGDREEAVGQQRQHGRGRHGGHEAGGDLEAHRERATAVSHSRIVSITSLAPLDRRHPEPGADGAGLLPLHQEHRRAGRRRSAAGTRGPDFVLFRSGLGPPKARPGRRRPPHSRTRLNISDECHRL